MKHYNRDHSFQQTTRVFYDEAKHYDLISKMQFIDMHTWLNGDLLHNADRTALAHSLNCGRPC